MTEKLDISSQIKIQDDYTPPQLRLAVVQVHRKTGEETVLEEAVLPEIIGATASIYGKEVCYQHLCTILVRTPENNHTACIPISYRDNTRNGSGNLDRNIRLRISR